jgi:hypothetical protein
MKDILVSIYNIVHNFLAVDLSLPHTASTILAVVALVLVIIIALRLAVGAVRWVLEMIFG